MNTPHSSRNAGKYHVIPSRTSTFTLEEKTTFAVIAFVTLVGFAVAIYSLIGA